MKLHLIVFVLCSYQMLSPAYGSDCPVTVPDLESPEGTLNSSRYHGWHGTNDLAALIPIDGHWNGMGPERNYFDKFWWWRQGYSAIKESKPNLIISGARLDGPAPSVLVTDTTSGFDENWNAMLVGMEFPTSGCWEVIGTYHGHQLKLILKVGDT